MAVFMVNICKFNSCGKNFRNLHELIHHIEEKHIDYDPRVLEQKESQQPACIALSYVLSFYTESSRKEIMKASSPINSPQTSTSSVTSPPNVAQNMLPAIVKSPDESSDADDEEMVGTDTDDSNDSWTTAEEFSSEFILKQGSKNASNNIGDDRPFCCPVPGCKKKYKNINGIKYHAKNGHKKNVGKIRKEYRCPCGKSYRSSSSLKSHTLNVHGPPGGNQTSSTTTAAAATVATTIAEQQTVKTIPAVRPGFTLVTKGPQGNVVQLGILAPSHLNSKTFTLTTVPSTVTTTQNATATTTTATISATN